MIFRDTDPYVLTTGEGMRSNAEINMAVDNFWLSYPAYRKATFRTVWMSNVEVEDEQGGFIVMALFKGKYVPAPVEAQEEGFGREVRAYESDKSFGPERSEGGPPLVKGLRVVFFHRAKVKAQYFCACVLEFQRQARKKSFEEQIKGDGSAESQWSEVFGGDPR